MIFLNIIIIALGCVGIFKALNTLLSFCSKYHAHQIILNDNFLLPDTIKHRLRQTVREHLFCFDCVCGSVLISIIFSEFTLSF